MVSPHGIKLATHLMSSFYGELCSKVCDCLLRRGVLTLSQIIRFTELSRENVINCLRVLIHQNCVQAFTIQQEGAFDETPKILTQYISLFDNIIHKSRSSKFMQIVSEELGHECLEIFLGLLQHGRLSLRQIIDRNDQTAGGSDVHALQENCIRLVNAKFIERCPAPEPFLSSTLEEESSAKKRNAKKNKATENLPTLEQRVIGIASPVESIRFMMEIDSLSEKNNLECPNKATAGEKRKQEDMNSVESMVTSGEEKEVLWRVNNEEFIRRLRAKSCVLYVKTRMNNESGIVLSAILELSRISACKMKAGEQVCLSLNAIYDEVIKKDGGISMDFERIRASLSQLGCTRSTDDGETYNTDTKGITEMARMEEAESVVLKRYGREVYRIFRALSKAGRVMDSNKIADETFVEKQDALKILHKLWKDDFLDMEKIVVNGARQSMLLLWRVNKQPLFEKFLDEMYHAALNLRLRIMHEEDQGKAILQLPSDKLVGDMQKKCAHLRKMKVIFESSLMNIDDAILLFQNF